jgi:hypothetical protein
MGVVERADQPQVILPKGGNPDWTIPQGHERYSEAEHRTWTTLYERQAETLPSRACEAFFRGLEALDLHGQGIPDFAQLNEKLSALTGWTIVAVPGLVPDGIFFDHLANRRFPAGNFIRGTDELDYLKEPDIFHDVFGHVPMLADPVFADYMQAYGKGGQRALSLGYLQNLARLYWYTVEFCPCLPFTQPLGVQPRKGDAYTLPHRRFPAGLFRDSIAAIFARHYNEDRFWPSLHQVVAPARHPNRRDRAWRQGFYARHSRLCQ